MGEQEQEMSSSKPSEATGKETDASTGTDG